MGKNVIGALATAVAILSCVGAYAQDNAYDVFNPIAKYISTGEAEKLSAWFSDNLEVTIFSNSNESSRMSVLGFGDHGSTYGGNPVCCAGAVSVMERLTDNFLASVKRRSGYIMAALAGAPGIESISGLGLMIGVKTTAPAGAVVKACIDKGVLFLTAKDKVRMLPALNIPMEDLEYAIETLKEVAKELGGNV